MESNPIVKWVRNKLGDQVNFFRVDVSTEVGKDLMSRYDIKLNSAYVVFDRHGKEVWRSYAIPLNG
ncbi:MAG: hypothetical protein ACE5HO_19920, partial [bacterium]